MKTIRILLFASCILTGLSSYAQVNNDYNIEQIEELLINALDNGENDRALTYALQLMKEDELSNRSVLGCAFILCDNRRYDDCYLFCDKWISKVDEFTQCQLYSFIGESSYYLHMYSDAGIYLEAFRAVSKRLDLDFDYYYQGLLADTDYYRTLYDNAIIEYKLFFDEVIKEEGVSLESIPSLESSGFWGNKLLYYAYSLFFCGNEKEGLKMLELSKLCGNEEASEDYFILSKNPNFAQESRINARTIREFDSYIEKYDIKEVVNSIRAEDLNAAFWDALQNNSASYTELMQAVNKKDTPPLLEQAFASINRLEDNIETELDEMYHPYNKGDIEKGIEKFLLGENNKYVDVRTYPEKEVNAFTSPFGQVYITDGLVRRYHFEEPLIYSVCAHELTHYFCQHSVISAWKAAEKQDKNEKVGGAVAALAMIGTIAAGMAAASNGVELEQSTWDNSLSIATAGVLSVFEDAAYLSKFKYDRDLEIEADIIAYRFCEYIGLGGYVYIMALQLLGDDDYYLKADATSNHPTTQYRVQLLKHLYAKEHSNTDKS